MANLNPTFASGKSDLYAGAALPPQWPFSQNDSALKDQARLELARRQALKNAELRLGAQKELQRRRTFNITSPDGRKFRVTGQGDAQGALEVVQKHLSTYEMQTPDGAIYEVQAPDEQTALDALTQMTGGTYGNAPDFAKIKRNIQRMIDQGAPESEIDQYVASEGVTAEQLRARTTDAATSQPQWSDLPGNIGPSAARLAGDVWQTVAHPVQTAQNIDTLARGGVMHIPGIRAANDFAVRNLGFKDSFAMPGAEHQYQVAGDVGLALKDRYGGLENIKRTMIEDPAGALLDASSLFTGGGGLLAKVPMAAKASKGLLAAGNALDPIANTGRAARFTSAQLGKVASYPFGWASGSAPQALQEAARAGYRGGASAEAFRANMRGHESPSVVVNEARATLDNIAEQRRNDYVANMKETTASTQIVDTKPIHKAVADLHDSLLVARPKPPPGTPSNAVGFPALKKGTPEEFAVLDEINSLLRAWENHPEGKTAIALDALKQRISRLQPSPTAQNAGNIRRIVTVAENAVKDAIVKQVPSYAKAMKEYAESKAATGEIEDTLSLSPNARTETSINKMLNAISGSGYKAETLKRLEESGGGLLRPRLAGQNLSNAMPKGMMGKLVAGLLGTGAWWNPELLAALPATSPRLLGETSHLLGRTTRRAGLLNPRAGMAAALLGRTEEEKYR